MASDRAQAMAAERIEHERALREEKAEQRLQKIERAIEALTGTIGTLVAALTPVTVEEKPKAK